MKTSKFGDFRILKTFGIFKDFRDFLKIYRFGRLRSFSGPDLDGQEDFGVDRSIGDSQLYQVSVLETFGEVWEPPGDPQMIQ